MRQIKMYIDTIYRTVILISLLKQLEGTCDHRYTHNEGSSGTFVSPNFPSAYPAMVTCTFYFDAGDGGRVKLHFDFFDLEEMAEGGCRFDYLDVYSVDDMGYKKLLSRFCGNELPDPVISLQPRMEIIFKSDYTKTLKGFLGHYEFLDDTWQPFERSTEGCGTEFLTGISGDISSPRFPGEYPADAKCTWLIKVKENQRIILTLSTLDIGTSVTCSDDKLIIYNGFATPDIKPDETLCGQLHLYDKRRKDFLSATSRVVVRFLSGTDNTYRNSGFKLVWTAVDLSDEDRCRGFLCNHQQKCGDKDAECTPGHRYCIDKSLRCNDVPNCGAYDDSDEQKCLREILIISSCVAGPILGILLIVIVTVFCYRQQRSVKKSASQEQPLTTSSSNTNSLPKSPSSRSQCLNMHTSFINGKVSDGMDPDDTDSVYCPSTSTDTYKSHQKRSSYHLMKEQADFNEGRYIFADI